MKIKILKGSPRQLKGLFMRGTKQFQPSGVPLLSTIQRMDPNGIPKKQPSYTKNVHLSHEYGFHPSLRRHFKDCQHLSQRFIYTNPAPKNDFFEFENFNDYSQFGKVTFDAMDIIWCSAGLVVIGGLAVWVTGDEPLSFLDTLDETIFLCIV
eukprot:210179_1